MLEMINPHVAKISLALKEGDSILNLSKKIGSSYGWTYNWIIKLEELGVITRENGIQITDQEMLNMFRDLGKELIKKRLDLKDAYLIPNFSGVKYAYTKTDAVFMWTKGGYQIARSKSDYPIFIKILKEDVESWKTHFDEFSIDIKIEQRGGKGIYFVLFPVDDFESEWVENVSVIPLDETVDWAEKYYGNFQPALEMLDDMYDLGLGIKYKERVKI